MSKVWFITGTGSGIGEATARAALKAAKAREVRLGSRASRSGPRRLDPRFSPLLTVPAAPFRLPWPSASGV